MFPQKNLILNGRFLTRKMTGVDRVAAELSQALVALLAQQGEQDKLRLAHPKASFVSSEERPKAVLSLKTVETFAANGYPWEQLALLRAAPDQWLLSLCNLGPVLRRNQAVMIHDAQIFTQPESYSKGFRLAYRALLPRLARRARVVLTVSDFSRRELEAAGVVEAGKAVVVHNGVDHMKRIEADAETLLKHGLKPKSFFLAIGSLAAHKNLPMLIAAAKARTDASIPLIIAGGGNSRVFRDQGLTEEKGVRFLGRVSDQELKALYEGARALVFPSKTEGFGLPPLEAMLCGSPVIATTGGAVPEACGDAVIYADPSKQNEWTQAMEKLTVDTDLLDDLSHRGTAHAADFTWDRSARRVLRAIVQSEKDTPC